jgi:hypothetical protein
MIAVPEQKIQKTIPLITADYAENYLLIMRE